MQGRDYVTWGVDGAGRSREDLGGAEPSN
eukprot:COSAG02_NODE_57311_length_281_cov_0.576923_1_plen_28_part_01